MRIQFERNVTLLRNIIQGYDGDHLCTTITKDEIKDKYERDSSPSESEFKAQKASEKNTKSESLHP